MTRYDIMEARWVILSNVWTDSNVIFGQYFIWIGYNNDQIWLPRRYSCDFEKCLNRLVLEQINYTFGKLYELGQMMTIYDLLEARWMFWAMFESTSTWHNFIFGQFSVARKLHVIIYGAAIYQIERHLVIWEDHRVMRVTNIVMINWQIKLNQNRLKFILRSLMVMTWCVASRKHECLGDLC